MLVAGCAAGRVDLKAANGGIRIFGAAFGAVGIPAGLNGAAATEEPCLRGCERIFDTIAVSIGYGHSGRIRKITTRNPMTTMFGVHPGDAATAGAPGVPRRRHTRRKGFFPSLPLETICAPGKLGPSPDMGT